MACGGSVTRIPSIIVSLDAYQVARCQLSEKVQPRKLIVESGNGQLVRVVFNHRGTAKAAFEVFCASTLGSRVV